MQTAKKWPKSDHELFSAVVCTLAAAAWVCDAAVRQLVPVEVWFRWGLAVATGGLAVRQWYHWLRCWKQRQMDDPGTAEAPEIKYDREYE